MADISINSNQKYLLDGNEYNAPLEWEDAIVIADYENDSIQPSISTESFTFCLQAREFILEWIRSGKIYEGLPFELDLFNINQDRINFKSVIDFTAGYRDLPNDGKLEASLIKNDGIDNFFNQIGTITYGYLESINVINDSDYLNVDYVVEKPFNLFEILTTSIIVYLMIKEVAESIKRIADQVANIISKSVMGPFGIAGSTTYAIAVAILNIVYTVALVIAIVDLTNTLISSLIVPKRQHKAINIKRALEIVCNYYGYGFITSVDEFSNAAYIPSNQEVDTKDKFGFIKIPKGTQKGIPNASDIGYNCQEMFDIAKKSCDGRFAIIDNEVHLRPKDDPYWIKNSSFELTDVLIQQKTFNMDELESTKLLKFQVDLNDEYTIDNYRGTSIEIKTDLISIGTQQNNMLKGFLEVDFGVALGSRKNELTPFEKLLKATGKIVDDTTKVLGKGTSFASKIKNRVGVLKQSSNWHSIPKLVYLNGNTLPVNHRELFSAPVLYNKYYQAESFVTENFKGQKAIYKDVVIPFGFDSYKKLTNNSYFKYLGDEAKIINFEWTMGEDSATIDFWVREVFTRNLKETQIIQT